MSTEQTHAVTRLAIGALLLSGCATLRVEAPVSFEAAPTPFAQEVYADEPLAHWRLNGAATGAIEGDPDGATRLQQGERLSLQGSDFGGPEFAVELWLKNPRGEALTYEHSGQHALRVSADRALSVWLLGERIDTGVVLDKGQWHLVGLSWRGEDGLMMVVVDGVLKWRGLIAKGKEVPFEGHLRLGGDFEGLVDEVAVFDQIKFAGHWLNRTQVARQLARPTPLDERQPLKVAIQRGHSAGVLSISWSPDGAMLASVGEDATLKVWDTDSGALFHDLSGHTGEVMNVAWSPDGARIASASEDKTIKIWDARSGALLHDLKGHEADVNSLAWHPDGAVLASGGEDEAIKVWDARSGALIHDLRDHAEGIIAVAWSPDGTRLAASFKDGLIKLHSAADGALVHDLEGHSDRVSSVVWRPDGTMLASCSEDGLVKVWDARSGDLIHDLKGHDDEVRQVRWSPDGERLASAGLDEAIKVWDARSGAMLHDLEGHEEAILSLAWSPDGAHIASSDEAGAVKLWDARSSALISDLEGHKAEAMAVAWSPDARTLATASRDTTIKLWDARSRLLVHDLAGRAYDISAVAWHPEGDLVATASWDRSVKVWDARNGVILHHMKGHTEGIYAMSWHPEGTFIASASRDGTVKIWDPHSGTLLHDLEGHEGWVMSAAWSPDGTRLASNGGGFVKVWDTRSGAQIRHFEEASGALHALSWSPDGARLASVGEDASLKVWDIERDALIHDLRGNRGDLTSVAWSPTGAHIAATCDDATVAIWDAKTGARLHNLKGHEGWSWALSWNPEGDALASVGEDGTVKVWDVGRGVLRHDLRGHALATSDVAWSPDGTKLASSSWDSLVKVWDAKGGTLLRTLKGHSGGVSGVAWHPKGTSIASGGADETLRLWDGQGDAVALLGKEDGRWLALTDEGYFSGDIASSDDLVVTQGLRVFAIDQLAPSRNRPEKILARLGAPERQRAFYEAMWRRRLKRLGVSEPQAGGNFDAAPSVRLLGTGEPDERGQTQVRMLFKDNAGLRGYRIHVNGVPLDPDLIALEGKRQRLSRSVQLTRGTNLIEISALNVQGIESLRASTSLDVLGEGLPAPRLFYLGFGVSDYADDRLDLGFAHQDAMDLQSALASNKGTFSAVHTRVFTDAQVTEGALDEARGFLSEVSAHDTLVMFIAGHGARDSDEAHTYYYLDHDARVADLAGSAIPFEQIEALLYESSARKKLFLMDTCQSGEDLELDILNAPLSGARGVKARSIERAVVWPGSIITSRRDDTRRWLSALRDRDRLIMQDLTRRSGAIVLASSLGQESSLEAPAWRNGAFTEEILRALQTKIADTNGDGLVDTGELIRHTSAAVPKLTDDRQHPNVERDNPAQRFALPISLDPTPP